MSDAFADIRGQEIPIERLRLAIRAGRLGHALIFAGPPGVGKRTTANALARALLCRDRPGEGCGRCAECHLVAAGTHPDLFVEDMERARIDRPTATQLSIEQVRRMRAKLAGRPIRGSRKVGILDPADRATPDAQNALLKTLEEPPGAATLVLVASNARALLPTILSRSQILRFAPLEPDAVAALLESEGIDPELARRTAVLAEGRLDRARILADEELCKVGEDVQARLRELERMSIPDLLDGAEELAGARGERASERQEIQRAALLGWYRDEMIAAANASSPADPEDRRAQIRRAWKRLARAYATCVDLERSANAQLAWNRLLLDLRSLA
jgi:DNA polymerase-3 subunit delta'